MNTLISISDPIAQALGPWAGELNLWSALLRIALVVFLAATIGCERVQQAAQRRPADVHPGGFFRRRGHAAGPVPLSVYGLQGPGAVSGPPCWPSRLSVPTPFFTPPGARSRA